MNRPWSRWAPGRPQGLFFSRLSLSPTPEVGQSSIGAPVHHRGHAAWLPGPRVDSRIRRWVFYSSILRDFCWGLTVLRALCGLWGPEMAATSGGSWREARSKSWHSLPAREPQVPESGQSCWQPHPAQGGPAWHGSRSPQAEQRSRRPRVRQRREKGASTPGCPQRPARAHLVQKLPVCTQLWAAARGKPSSHPRFDSLADTGLRPP